MVFYLLSTVNFFKFKNYRVGKSMFLLKQIFEFLFKEIIKNEKKIAILSFILIVLLSLEGEIKWA